MSRERILGKGVRFASMLLAIAVIFSGIPMLTGELFSNAATPTTIKAKAVATSSSAIKVTWNKIRTPYSGYAIYRNGVLIKRVGKGTTSYTNTGLNSDTKYRFQVGRYKKYYKKQWYNKKTKKWQTKKPAKKYRGKSKKVAKYSYSKKSSSVYATTKKVLSYKAKNIKHEVTGDKRVTYTWDCDNSAYDYFKVNHVDSDGKVFATANKTTKNTYIEGPFEDFKQYGVYIETIKGGKVVETSDTYSFMFLKPSTSSDLSEEDLQELSAVRRENATTTWWLATYIGKKTGNEKTTTDYMGNTYNFVEYEILALSKHSTYNEYPVYEPGEIVWAENGCDIHEDHWNFDKTVDYRSEDGTIVQTGGVRFNIAKDGRSFTASSNIDPELLTFKLPEGFSVKEMEWIERDPSTSSEKSWTMNSMINTTRTFVAKGDKLIAGLPGGSLFKQSVTENGSSFVYTLDCDFESERKDATSPGCGLGIYNDPFSVEVIYNGNCVCEFEPRPAYTSTQSGLSPHRQQALDIAQSMLDYSKETFAHETGAVDLDLTSICAGLTNNYYDDQSLEYGQMDCYECAYILETWAIYTYGEYGFKGPASYETSTWHAELRLLSNPNKPYGTSFKKKTE